MPIDVKVNQRQLDKILKELQGVRGGLKRVVPPAINKTLTRGRAMTAREIKQEVNLKIGTIKKHLGKENASRKRWVGSIKTLKTARKRIPLIEFGARQLKSGDVSYKITQKEGRKKIQYDKKSNPVFIATMPSGHKGVFKRVGMGVSTWRGRGGASAAFVKSQRWLAASQGLKTQIGRLPITELRGPSLTRAVNRASGRLRRRLRKDLMRTFNKNLASQVDRVLKRAG